MSELVGSIGNIGYEAVIKVAGEALALLIMAFATFLFARGKNVLHWFRGGHVSSLIARIASFVVILVLLDQKKLATYF
jgi:hypothetical protein